MPNYRYRRKDLPSVVCLRGDLVTLACKANRLDRGKLLVNTQMSAAYLGSPERIDPVSNVISWVAVPSDASAVVWHATIVYAGTAHDRRSRRPSFIINVARFRSKHAVWVISLAWLGEIGCCVLCKIGSHTLHLGPQRDSTATRMIVNNISPTNNSNVSLHVFAYFQISCEFAAAPSPSPADQTIEGNLLIDS